MTNKTQAHIYIAAYIVAGIAVIAGFVLWATAVFGAGAGADQTCQAIHSWDAFYSLTGGRRIDYIDGDWWVYSGDSGKIAAHAPEEDMLPETWCEPNFSNI